ncbi:hypothetical protein K432DRAFT_407299 [Lepidopterella palustris CBS 459.81]|uniref:Uncharacterized protein n=1 Tax=Lepidopterella palustris CBS 459.81 TaxID=1314670 RepID=A0A8E2JCE7_9PEZI|nr:hypothetical protein K432DRAFT_407299 [Lepidopterella palustris CBS 459.81]
MAENKGGALTENQEPPLKPPFSAPPTVNSASSQNAISSTPSSNPDHGASRKSAPPLPTSALGSLPTISRKDHLVFLVEDDIDTFLKRDLDLTRLNRIHHLLWMAGRPLNARPLHRQQMMGFDVLLTEQADLHLLKFSNRLFVKPLPEYMLSYEFWKKYLCASKELHESACGFLLSYVWLICSPLDLSLARKLDLLPSFVTWPLWKGFVTSFVTNVDVNALDQVNKRYHFGELRLGRINSIYRTRFMFTHFVRGYLYGYNRYVVFFQRNFGWVLVVFAFFSLVLSAMQVGVGVPPVNSNAAFQHASYGFVVFVIVSVASLLAFIGVMFAVIFLFNMIAAISHDKMERIEREKLAQDRKNKTKSA